MALSTVGVDLCQVRYNRIMTGRDV